MKKKTPIMDLYYQWIKRNQLTIRNRDTAGLCHTVLSELDSFDLINPSNQDYNNLVKENQTIFYWGKGVDKLENKYDGGKFSPLRQNLVLLLACLNNEL